MSSLRTQILGMGCDVVNKKEYAEVLRKFADSEHQSDIQHQRAVEQVKQLNIRSVRLEDARCDSCGDNHFVWQSYCNTCKAASSPPMAKLEDANAVSWAKEMALHNPS